MECREAVQLDGQHAAVGLAKAAEALADANRQRDETLADLGTTQARRDADRAKLVGEFPEPLLGLYVEQLLSSRSMSARSTWAASTHASPAEWQRF